MEPMFSDRACLEKRQLTRGPYRRAVSISFSERFMVNVHIGGRRWGKKENQKSQPQMGVEGGGKSK